MNIEPHWRPKTKVSMKHWRVDKNHSNAYTAFKEAGSPKLPNPIDIDEKNKQPIIALFSLCGANEEDMEDFAIMPHEKEIISLCRILLLNLIIAFV